MSSNLHDLKAERAGFIKHLENALQQRPKAAGERPPMPIAVHGAACGADGAAPSSVGARGLDG